MTDRDDPIEDAVGRVLLELGEDPLRDGLQKTPSRVSQALRFFTDGYQRDPREILEGRFFGTREIEVGIAKEPETFSPSFRLLYGLYRERGGKGVG